jgi:hypothetical protein
MTDRICALCSVLVVAGTASAADYWVSPKGEDRPNRGGKSAPFVTIQYAADRVKPGDVVHVVDGEYVGFHVDFSGTPTARITFVAEGDDVKITSRNKNTPDGINVEDAKNVTIDGFLISEMRRAGVRGAHADGLHVRRVRADKNREWGIFTSHCDDAVIEYNIVARSRKQHGIYVSNSGDRPIIRGNVSFGNVSCGIHMNGDLSQGGDGIISGAVVESNTIYGNGAVGGSGINADGVQNSKFLNNVLYENLGRGIALFKGDAAGPSKDNLIAYNTIAMPIGSRWAINIKDGSTGNVVVNNILVHAQASRGPLLTSFDSLTGLASDYNVVAGKFTSNDGDRLLSLENWRSTVRQDEHSIVANLDDLFVDPAKGNFRLRAGSPAVAAGDPAHRLKYDRDLRPRAAGSRPTVGAYEYETKPNEATLFLPASPPGAD